MSAPRSHLPAALLLTGLVIGCYWTSLGNGFTYDDEVLIVKNEMVKSFASLPLLVSKAYFTHSTVVSYRPIFTLTYFLDYHLWGLNPFGFHLTNLLLHLVTTLLVYALFTRLLARWDAALVGAALFAAHPVLTNAVDNIGHRADVLAGGLVLLALCCLLWSERRPYGSTRGFVAIGLAAYSLALLTKETAVVLPALLLVVDWTRGRLDRTRLPLYAGVSLLTGGYLVLRFVLMNNPIEWASSLPSFEARLKGWPYATWFHLQLLMLPLGLSAEHVFQPPAGVTDPMVVFPAAVIVSVLLGLVWLWYRGERLACLGLVWIFIALGPVANLIANFSLPIAERYLYLPAVGWALLLTLALTRLRSRAVAGGLAVALLVTYGALTLERHPVWYDNMTLWMDAVEKIPEEPTAHNNLGAQYEARGEFTRALREYAWAAFLSPDFAGAYKNAGWVYVRQGRLDLAAHQFERVVRLRPHDAPALTQLGLVYQRQGRFDRAIALYRAWFEDHPGSAELYSNLGTALAATGQRAAAKKAFEQALALNPREAVIHNNLGTLYAEQGNLDKAIQAYHAALRLNPRMVGVHENLATVYQRQGRWSEAQNERAAGRSVAPR